jgi:hypothetical protein
VCWPCHPTSQFAASRANSLTCEGKSSWHWPATVHSSVPKKYCLSLNIGCLPGVMLSAGPWLLLGLWISFYWSVFYCMTKHPRRPTFVKKRGLCSSQLMRPSVQDQVVHWVGLRQEPNGV